MKRVPIGNDEVAIQLFYEEEVSEERPDILSCDGDKDLLQVIAAKRPDLILLDLKTGSGTGLSLLQDIRNAFNEIPVIVTTNYPVLQMDSESVGQDGI
jgi:DNA-binding NtrC family response regulator